MKLRLEIEVSQGRDAGANLARQLESVARDTNQLLALGDPLPGNPRSVGDTNGKSVGRWAFIDDSHSVASSELLWVLHFFDGSDAISHLSGPYPAAEAEARADAIGSVVADEVAAKLIAKRVGEQRTAA
jgi:hypothetical protein